MKQVILLSTLSLFISCSTQKELTTKPYMIWVKGIQAECTGVGPMKCLLIQKSENIDPEKWEYFYSPIEGFQLKNGTRFKLLISEGKIDDSQVPADGSTIKYKLTEILEQMPEPVFALHDIWALESIDGNSIKKPEENSGLTIPMIEINVNEMKIMGTDGCNQFFGPIKNVEDESIEIGNLGSTMKMCVDMQLSDQFNQTLGLVSKYKRNGNILTFFDELDKELLRFKKVD